MSEATLERAEERIGQVVELDLRKVFEDVMDTQTVTALEKDLELSCLIAEEVPILLRGDRDRLLQVLTNLANNALKYTDQGEVTIRAELAGESSDRTSIRFLVTDTGIGIPKDRVDLLFKSFSRIDTSMTRGCGGTGLGLAISRKLVELMGGEIGVESEEGRGSTFWFTVAFERWAPARTATPVAEGWSEAGDGTGNQAAGCIDIASLTKRYRRKSVKRIMSVFLADAEQELESIREASKRGDIKAIVFHTHALKGASGSVGAHQLQETALAIERAGKEGNLAAVSSLLPLLESRFAQCRQVGREIMEAIG